MRTDAQDGQRTAAHTAIIAVIGLFGVLIVPGGALTMHADMGFLAIDHASVSDAVMISFEDRAAYHRAYVAEAPVEDVAELDHTEMETVDLTSTNTAAPSDVWPGADLERQELVLDHGMVDVSGLEPGRYVAFTWACDTGGPTPENCGWTTPHTFERAAGTGAASVRDWIPDGLIASGHRGAGSDENDASLAPENTIMAFDLTTNEIGLNGVELDVRRADDGIVVIHDSNPSRTTGEYGGGLAPWDNPTPVADLTVDTLTALQADNDYNPPDDADDAVSPDEAASATIPSFDETLDFFQDDPDVHLRLDIKGSMQGDQDAGRTLYRKVADRGMLDQVIFMSFPGDCNHNLPGDGRDCSYPVLEGVEAAADEDGTDATTAVLWQKRDGVLGTDGRALPWKRALREADGKFDIFVPRDHRVIHGIQNGLGGADGDRHEFVREANRRGLDYAFMSFGDSGEGAAEELAYGVEWLSTNRPDRLKDAILSLGMEEYYGDLDVDLDEGLPSLHIGEGWIEVYQHADHETPDHAPQDGTFRERFTADDFNKDGVLDLSQTDSTCVANANDHRRSGWQRCVSSFRIPSGCSVEFAVYGNTWREGAEFSYSVRDLSQVADPTDRYDHLDAFSNPCGRPESSGGYDNCVERVRLTCNECVQEGGECTNARTGCGDYQQQTDHSCDYGTQICCTSVPGP